MNYLDTQIASQINSVYNIISRMPASEDRKELIDRFLSCADKLREIKDEEIKISTRLNYLYRDAGNWKTCQTVVLAGQMTDEIFNELVACCEDGHELFIPEQVGLDLIRDWQTTEDDHPYCELEDYELVPDKPTTDITVLELLERFRNAKGNWDPDKYYPEVYDEEEDD